MSTYSDKEIMCRCGVSFIWTKGEQNFMHQLLDAGKIQVVEEPKRCKACLQKKKLRHPKI